jgi:hypothetical protein
LHHRVVTTSAHIVVVTAFIVAVRATSECIMAAEVAMAEVIAEVMAAATRGLFLTFASRFQRAFLRMLESKPWQM